MKSIVALLIISVCVGSTADAQKRTKKPAPRSRGTITQPSSTAVNKPRIIGSAVVIITKNGDRIAGELLELTAYSVRIRANNLESTIALDTIASLSLGGAPAPNTGADQPAVPVRADFAPDAETALRFFHNLAANLKTGVDYTEYGRQLAELRRAGERFISKYSSTDNASEARVVSLVAGALTDYSWARILWTLKFGRTSDGTIGEADSPTVVDVLTLYPDLRAAAAAGQRLSAEKLLAGVWRKASEKVDRARTLLAPHR
ncbi:MAG TPA: hypothetical protein VLM38_18040 [Blastocatellia bacterium]|nr:hypothetical protein [Blastocatellia bacterium]